MSSKLPPFELVTTAPAWEACLARLRQEPRLAVDLESNNMFVYREKICLIQISIPGQDYIIDPLTELDFSPLGELMVDARIEKIFHAVEYDLILMKREHAWEVNNLFDTMWAARVLGYPKIGLANVLKETFGLELQKKYQRANWGKRPLTAEQLAYAQHDTHHLLDLRERLARELKEKGRWDEALEAFELQTHVKLPDISFKPDGFWSIKGAQDLSRRQQAVLHALYIYRNQVAKKRDTPPFKVLGNRTLIELAGRTPSRIQELHAIHGLSPRLVRQQGRQILKTIQRGLAAPLPVRRRKPRKPDAIVNRYDLLANWRKEVGLARGVESDVIVSRDALWEIAEVNPHTVTDLAKIESIGAWRVAQYGAEIIELLHKP